MSEDALPHDGESAVGADEVSATVLLRSCHHGIAVRIPSDGSHRPGHYPGTALGPHGLQEPLAVDYLALHADADVHSGTGYDRLVYPADRTVRFDTGETQHPVADRLATGPVVVSVLFAGHPLDDHDVLYPCPSQVHCGGQSG